MHEGDWRVRGKEISRVEGLSDAVFGFAITLLIISLEVPTTAGEVLHAMRGFFAFAITFGLLFRVWRLQFGFFRRYGLEDNTTVNLTAVLLFVVLFFVYPLKFVFTAIMERVLAVAGFPDPAAPNLFRDERAATLMVTYALGWMAVFGVFALLYRHAYRKRVELQLSPLEEFDTRESIATNVFTASIGLPLGLTYIAADLAKRGRVADGISVVMTVIMLAMLVALARWKRWRRGRRKELRAQIAAAVEA